MEEEYFEELVTGLKEMVAFEKGILEEKVNTQVIKPRFQTKLVSTPPPKKKMKMPLHFVMN